MACWGMVAPGQNAEERAREVADLLAQVRAQLADGRIKLALDARGAVRLAQGAGLGKPARMADVCVLQQVRGSTEYRTALLAAEQRAGVRGVALIGARGVAVRAGGGAGHSHDGGRTWHPDHKKG